MSRVESSLFAHEVARAPRRGRSYGVYRDILGYRGREHQLAGKIILDVGGGDSGFAEGARRYGAHVVQLDPKYDPRPKYLTADERQLYQYTPPQFREGAIAAVAQQLPFKDNSFDEVSALYSVYWMNVGVKTALSEMLRVTKDYGTLTIWPAKITAQQREDLPSFLHIRTINPDYGYPTVLEIIKEPQLALHMLDTIVPLITASEIQQQNALLYAANPNKPNPTGPWRNS